ncbi:MAG: hypothetical protein K2O53_00185 [Bacteroidales bacterium]|nr:hypothetical protein [Bacteroidales bacterium]MDE7090133.1 hypothetical protein [Bacteroidales bacterium]MDE7103782.1 hypothetical protein [Bacteroidales bacterium]
MDTNLNPQTAAPKRPNGLTLLCILTFIGSGCNALTYLFMAANLNTIKDLLLYSDTYAELYASVPAMEEAVTQVVALGPAYFWVQTLLCLGSLAGAICMFKRIFAGFHIYTIAQCLLILWNMYQTGWGVPYGSIFLSGAFVALYAMFLPYLKNKDGQPLPPYDPNHTEN